MPPVVNLVAPDGRTRAVEEGSAEYQFALDSGWRPETGAEAAAIAGDEFRRQGTEGVGGGILAAIGGVARAISGGASDVLLDAVGGGEYFDALREERPNLSLAGEIAGAVTPLGIPGAAARAGERVAGRIVGEGAARTVGRKFVGGAVEGGIQGLGAGVSEIALSDDPLTVERIASTLGTDMLLGAGIGGGFNAAGAGLHVALGKASRKLKEIGASAQRLGAIEQAAPGAVDDLVGLDAKGLRAARKVELDAIEAARVPERASLGQDIGAFRDEVKDQKIWLATKAGAKDSGETLAAAEVDPRTDRVEVVRVGRPSAGTYEIRTYRAGAAEPEVSAPMKRDEVYAALAEPTPGFGVGGLSLGAGTSVERGIPAAAADIKVDSLYVTRPSELAERGVFGNELHPEHVASIKSAWAEGKRLAPVDIDVTPDGKLYIEDGNHRLFTAAADDRPVLVRFRPTSPAWKPQKGAVDVTERLRPPAPAAAPKTKTAPRSREIRAIAKMSLDADKALDRVLRDPKTLAEQPRRALSALRQQENALERMIAKGDELRASFAGDKSGERLAALELAPAALERNRALQARIIAVTGDAQSPRLTAIQEMADALASGGKAPEVGIGQQMLGGTAFGMTAGVVGAVPVIGPVLAPFVGAAASSVVTGRIAGKVSQAVAAVADRTSRAIDKILDVSAKARPVTRAIPVVATRVLARARYGPGEAEPEAPKGKQPKPERLAELYKKRSEEIRSLTTVGPDGVPLMRREARARVAAQLTGLGLISPLLADQIETLAARRVEFLAGRLPRRPDLAALPTGPDRWQPSDMQMRTWARYVAGVEDPGAIEERLADGSITPEDAEVMREVYPERMEALKAEIVSRLPTLQRQLPYHRRLALSIFSGVPVDPAMNPQILRVLQASFANEPGSVGGTMAPQASPAFGSVRSQEKPTPAQQRAGA